MPERMVQNRRGKLYHAIPRARSPLHRRLAGLSRSAAMNTHQADKLIRLIDELVVAVRQLSTSQPTPEALPAKAEDSNPGKFVEGGIELWVVSKNGAAEPWHFQWGLKGPSLADFPPEKGFSIHKLKEVSYGS
jgi:hypothetical protein